HHESHNVDTAQRIRRSLRNRFQNGGVVQFVIYGYIKPEAATSDEQLCKDPAADENGRDTHKACSANSPEIMAFFARSQLLPTLDGTCAPCRSHSNGRLQAAQRKQLPA
ncbi:MAG TPA: hypothetical protein PKC18_17445, partial [Lacipirellulaceae bacterium]|nr:hypothetical protein [Lacipirellulaceae bacterium]